MTAAIESVSVPSGYGPLFRTSQFLDATGPYFCKRTDGDFFVGLRILSKHLNSVGSVHGGLLATLADVSLGYATALSRDPHLQLTTANLSLDFVRAAKCGDWVESRVSILKTGNRLAFANAVILANDVPVASARAVFMVLSNIT
jgi:acyl-coenzyme A thioesterase 13